MTKKQKTTSGISASQRYWRLVRSYKASESLRLGIPTNKVKVTGNSEQAQRFKKGYAIIKNPNKPMTWRRDLAKLGFGETYWSAYRESKSSGLADVQTREI